MDKGKRACVSERDASPANRIHCSLQELVLSSLVTFDSGTQVEDALGHWRMAFRTVQAWEAWECHREWISSTSPNFGPGIKDRFLASSKIPPEKVEAMKAEREKVGAGILHV